MRQTPRRMMFQLVSLFDMLMIIIFAQYLDVQQRAREAISRAESEAREAERKARTAEERALETVRKNQSESTVLQEAQRTLRTAQAERDEARRQVTRLGEELQLSREQLDRVGQTVLKIFEISDKKTRDLFKAESPADAARLRELLAKLSGSSSGEVIRHILAHSELEKRVDIWTLHITDAGLITLEAGDQRREFRAVSAAAFQSEMFRIYKALAQPKRLVVVLCTWGWQTGLGPRQAVYDGIGPVTDRMTEDSDRRSRFEFAWLGPLKLGDRK